MIGTSVLSTGISAGGICTYSFQFLKTKTNLASYAIQIPSQPSMTMTRCELQLSGWRFSLRYGPPTTTVTGSLELTDEDTALAGCQGQGGYADIAEGATVLITDQDNRILGSGALDAGTASGDVCTYAFSISAVRQDEQQYAVEVTHRGKVVNNYAAMISNGWIFGLTLGY